MQEAKPKGNILAICVCFALFFMIAFVTNFAGAMGPILKNQFNVSNAASQIGSAANFFAYLFMGIPGGLILKRKGYKFTSLLAAAVGFAGVGVQLASAYCGENTAFPVYVCGAFIAGFAMCLLNLVVNPLLNTLGGEGKKGNQLVQFGCSLNSIGATLSPIILGWLVGVEVAKANVGQAIPALVVAMAIFVVAFLVIAFSEIPEPSLETEAEKKARKAGETSVVKDIIATLGFRHFSLGALAIFFYIIVECGIPNMAMLYMTDVAEVPRTEVAITAAEANRITLEAVQKDKAKESELKQAEKAFGAGKVSKDEYGKMKGDIEKKYERKPGEVYEIVKTKNADGEFEKFDTSKGKIVPVDGKGEYVKVSCRTGESYVGAAVAGLIVGAYWFCMMVGRLLGGVVGGKISSRAMITGCSVAGIALLMAAMFVPFEMIDMFGITFPLPMAFAAACGLCTSVMWGGIFNMAAEGLGKYVPMGSGIFMAMVFGGVCLPLQGMLADAVGILGSYWMTIGLLAYILFYALVGSRVTKRAE